MANVWLFNDLPFSLKWREYSIKPGSTDVPNISAYWWKLLNRYVCLCRRMWFYVYNFSLLVLSPFSLFIIEGFVPSELSQITLVAVFSFRSNILSGMWYVIIALVVEIFSHNFSFWCLLYLIIEGTIPTELSLLTSMTYLSIRSNILTGMIVMLIYSICVLPGGQWVICIYNLSFPFHYWRHYSNSIYCSCQTPLRLSVFQQSDRYVCDVMYEAHYSIM